MHALIHGHDYFDRRVVSFIHENLDHHIYAIKTHVQVICPLCLNNLLDKWVLWWIVNASLDGWVVIRLRDHLVMADL